MKNPIRQLSASVINKIAAGEVIERPASVVKELIENSVDSGATQIELAIEKGGIEMIRVTDNGSGIAKDQLPLAVTSHATSKIVDADDLFKVGTFGFRGEALASIAEISQTIIRSRTEEDDCGYELTINGGKHEPIEPAGAPVGTTIEVRQLFYNTPVRQKFLKTPGTEKGHIAEAFTRVALAHPEIAMTMWHNGKVQHQLPATDSWRERIEAFFGPEISNSLISVENEVGDVKVCGFVVDPAVSRANNRMQYLFLNGRYIRDRSLQHALSESYRGLLMVGRFPICFLRLAMPFSLVDVNVHPAKLEVRFQNGGQIYSQLLGTVRNRFLTTDLTSKAQLTRPGSVDDFKPFPGSAGVGATGVSIAPEENQSQISFAKQNSSIDWTQAPRNPFPAPAMPAFPNTPSHSAIGGTPSGAFASGSAGTATHGSATTHGSAVDSDNPFAFPGQQFQRADATHAHARPAPTQTLTALQVHNTYLISESDEGMLVIDQHALHERVIYEQIRDKILEGKLESQKLLVPEPVHLPPAEAALVLEHTEVLAKIGVDVESFGGDTILVTAYPAMLAKQNPAEILRNIVDQLVAGKKQLDSRDLIDELLHMISCKAAVKAGDKLASEEITALLEHRELCQDAHHCPHGRPTSLVFTREELDKRFKRIK